MPCALRSTPYALPLSLSIRPDRNGRDRRAAAGERCLLGCLVVHHRLQIVNGSGQLVVARLCQVALRLDDEEAAGHAGLELLLFRFKALFREGSRRARGLDSFAVGLNVSCEITNLSGDLKLRALKLLLCL